MAYIILQIKDRQAGVILLAKYLTLLEFPLKSKPSLPKNQALWVRRSQKSVLKNEKLIKLGIKLLSPWQDALKRYLNIIKE